MFTCELYLKKKRKNQQATESTQETIEEHETTDELQISPKKKKQQIKMLLMKQSLTHLKNMKLQLSLKKKVPQINLKKKPVKMKVVNLLSLNVVSVRPGAFLRWL